MTSSWAFELAWGGVRAVVRVDGGRAAAWSLDGSQLTGTYPELCAMAEAMGATPAVLDGELVALDASGHPQPALLQQRMDASGASRIRRLASTVPVTYFVAALLHLDGRSTLALPYRERRAHVESEYRPGERSGSWLEVGARTG